MPKRRHRTTCKFPGCDAPRGAISARGWCLEHGTERIESNIVQLRSRRGPFYEGWYEAMHQRFEFARRLDDVRASE